MTATLTHSMVQRLQKWADSGWLRRIDCALAQFASQHDPQASDALIVATALLAHFEGRGHTCLPLSELLNTPQAMLGWPAGSQDELTTVWRNLPDTTDAWIHTLASSRLVRSALINDGAPQQDVGQPFVLGGSRAAPLLYLRRYWGYEEQVRGRIQDCSETKLPVQTELARAWLDRLFPETTPSQGTQDTAIGWQKVACALALSGRLTLITGGPGTGKTYTAARLLALMLAMHPDRANLKVALAAPTGKAAARLKQSIELSLTQLPLDVSQELNLAQLTQRIGPARTIHSLLGARPDTRRFRHDSRHPLDLDLLIVDETSMVHLELMAAVLQALPPHAKLVLLGDPHQLASVEAGAVLGDLCEQADGQHYNQDTVEYIRDTTGQTVACGHPGSTQLAQRSIKLQFSHRFDSAIGQLARAVNQNSEDTARKTLSNSGVPIHHSPRRDPAVVLAIALNGREGSDHSHTNYLKEASQAPAPDSDLEVHTAWVKRVLRTFEAFRILCAVHDGPWGERDINLKVQQALAKAGWIHPHGAWYRGRPVMVTRNEPALGVFNGDVGVVLPSPSGSLRAYFLDGENLRSVSVSRLAHVETAFAMTVHKSQGSEFQHTLLVLPDRDSEVLTRELVYTGITRAKTYLTIIEGQDNVLISAIGNPVARTSGLKQKLA